MPPFLRLLRRHLRQLRPRPIHPLYEQHSMRHTTYHASLSSSSPFIVVVLFRRRRLSSSSSCIIVFRRLASSSFIVVVTTHHRIILLCRLQRFQRLVPLLAVARPVQPEPSLHEEYVQSVLQTLLIHYRNPTQAPIRSYSSAVSFLRFVLLPPS